MTTPSVPADFPLHLTIMAGDLNVVVAAIGQQPYNVVSRLMQSLELQVSQQIMLYNRGNHQNEGNNSSSSDANGSVPDSVSGSSAASAAKDQTVTADKDERNTSRDE